MSAAAPARTKHRIARRRQETLASLDVPAKSERDAEKQLILASMHPSRLTRNNFDWTAFVWIGGMHVGALAAPFFFTWQALGVTVFLHWLTLSIGI